MTKSDWEGRVCQKVIGGQYQTKSDIGEVGFSKKCCREGMGLIQKCSVGQSLIGQQKCVMGKEEARLLWGIQKVYFSPTRWQHFFETKKGWGVDP